MEQLPLILMMAALIFSVRFVVFAFAGKVKLSDTTNQALSFVPPAVLAAIVVPAMFSIEQGVSASLLNPNFIGIIVAIIASIVSKNFLLNVVLGTIAFALAQALLT